MVASVLLGTTPPVLPVRVLVRTCELFGIAEGTTRVAISRMQAAGELEGDGGRYRLAGRLLARQTRQEQSRHPRLSRWSARSGQWRIGVVTAGGRAGGGRAGGGRAASARAELREAMRALRLAEWREGVWVRPDNLPRGVLGGAEAVAAAQCEWVAGRPEADGAELAARLWDLRGWEATAAGLREEMAASLPRLRAGDTGELAPAFVLAAAVLRHQQADPLLPDTLLPPTWPGTPLRHEYETYEAAFRTVLRAWTSTP